MVVTVRIEVFVVFAFGKVRLVGLKVAVIVAWAGETVAVNWAGPTKRVLAPLPFTTDTVAVFVLATPVETLAELGEAVSEENVLAANAG